MNFSKPNLNIGVIGSGFMGKTHVYGFAIADRVFDLPYKLNLISIADVNSKVANSAAKKLGFQRKRTPASVRVRILERFQLQLQPVAFGMALHLLVFHQLGFYLRSHLVLVN